MGAVAPIGVQNPGREVAGVDTWRWLFRADASAVGKHVFDVGDGYRGNWFPAHGLLAVEGHPAGRGSLCEVADLRAAFAEVEALVAPFGGEAPALARVDLASGHRFPSSREGRAFFAGMASTVLPRCETTRRGTPVHSVWWTGARGREIKARVYDKGLEAGTAEAFEVARLEDQRRLRNGARVDLGEVSDREWVKGTFSRKFDPVRKAVDGVKCASLPVIAQALADEARYGYREWKEAERLAGSLILLAGGAAPAYGRSTLYSRRAELRAAGYVVADAWMEPVEVDLGEVVEAAVEAW